MLCAHCTSIVQYTQYLCALTAELIPVLTNHSIWLFTMHGTQSWLYRTRLYKVWHSEASVLACWAFPWQWRCGRRYLKQILGLLMDIKRQMFLVYGRRIYQHPSQSLLHNSAVGKGGHCASNLRQRTAKLPLTMWKSTSTCVLDPFRNGLSRSPLTQWMCLLLRIRNVLWTETPHCEACLFCVAQVVSACGFIFVSSACMARCLCYSVSRWRATEKWNGHRVPC